MRVLATIGGAIAGALVLAIPAPVAAQDPEANRCAPADALRLAGEKESARKDYVALLRSDATLECAREGLLAINVPPTNEKEASALCDRGDAYRRLHRRDDALKAYKSALEKDPHNACAEAGIPKTRLSAPVRLLDGATAAIPRLLLAGGLILAVLFLVLLLGYWGRAHAVLVRLPIVGSILSPRLNFEPFVDESDAKVGAAIEARIKERLTRMREMATLADAPDHELDFGTPREDFAKLVARDGGLKSALDKASEASEHTKVVAALLHLLHTLLPIRRLTVGGVVEPPAEPYPSATLSLEKDGSLAAAATLVGAVPEPRRDLEASDYLKLAGPAAVWAQYEVARAIQGNRNLGPDDAESYALLREGLERQLAGDYTKARQLYERALELDQNSWAARLNLAVTEARLAQDYDEAVEILAAGFYAIEGK